MLHYVACRYNSFRMLGQKFATIHMYLKPQQVEQYSRLNANSDSLLPSNAIKNFFIVWTFTNHERRKIDTQKQCTLLSSRIQLIRGILLYNTVCLLDLSLSKLRWWQFLFIYHVISNLGELPGMECRNQAVLFVSRKE